MSYAEDAQVILKILIQKQTIGVVKEAIYWYRKRRNNSASAIQSSGKTYAWYIPYLEKFQMHSVAHCKNTIGYVPLFAQNILMYDLQWRFRMAHLPSDILSPTEADAYRNDLKSLLAEIEDQVIIAQWNLSFEQKLFLLQLKHPDILPKVVFHNVEKKYLLSFNDTVLYNFDQMQLKIHFLKLHSDRVEIEGSYLSPICTLGQPKLFVVCNGQCFDVQENHYDEMIYSIDTPIAIQKGFHVSAPLFSDKPSNITFRAEYEAFSYIPQNLIWGKYSPITNKIGQSYYHKNGHIIRPIRYGFRAVPATKKDARKAEICFLRVLWNHKDRRARKAAISRIVVHILRPFAPKNLWLITDKADRADDNGEAFFLYCTKYQKKSNCYPVFAIGKSSPDYARLKKDGIVVPYMSWRHKLCHLLATHTISAYSHDEISSPFLDYSYFYNDLLQENQIVFLQHGITKDDVSIALNRFHKNFSMVVTSVIPEYQSFLDGNYGYTGKQIALTGLPRYDRLYNNVQRKITIMPTWRRKLFGSYNPNTSQWSLLPGFEDSDFSFFYSSLMNSSKLHAAAQKHGYEIQFLAHPILFPYLDHFSLDPNVKILKADTSYRDVFAESSLILTDYSSVAFDMAYLRKPVLYAHFDTNHYSEGYFDYERDGFGEVEYTLDGTIDRIIEYMENGCVLKDKYRQRIDQFFAFNDQNNCQRVYVKIRELDSQ